MTRHTARSELAAQLDVLMGVTRDGTAGDGPSTFYDPAVCRSYLCGLCPYDLFTNTKVDMGKCESVHSDGLKVEYEAASKTRDFGYEVELLRYLERMIMDLQTKIERESVRLADDGDEGEREEKRLLTAERQVQVNEMLHHVEVLAEEGKVEESMALMKKAEELKVQPLVTKKQQDIQAELASVRSTRPNFVADQRSQQLRCCDVCGALLSIFETDRCLADHFGGKQHLGYLAIREKIKTLKEFLKEDKRVRIYQGQEARSLESEPSSAVGKEAGDDRERKSGGRDDRGHDHGDRSHERRRDERYRPYDRDRDGRRRYDRYDDRDRYRRREDDRYDRRRDRYRERERDRI